MKKGNCFPRWGSGISWGRGALVQVSLNTRIEDLPSGKTPRVIRVSSITAISRMVPHSALGSITLLHLVVGCSTGPPEMVLDADKVIMVFHD